MKKRMTLIALVLVCALALTACGCKHENWNAADCLNPRTCADCGQTEGEALGHNWVEADCLTPKTCADCGETEGEALGHDWAEATCEEAKTCARCAEAEGEALGHSWLDATTEAPKTCEACGKTEGEKIIVDSRFTTAANQHLFGKWQTEITLTGADLGAELAPYVDELPCYYIFEFRNDGTLGLSVLPKDEAQMKAVMCAYTEDLLYQQLADSGLDAEAANAAVLQAFGMNIKDYVAYEVEKMDMTELLAAFAVEYVYYVDGDQMYLGFSWDFMENETYSLEDDVLYMPLSGADPVPFTRVVE